MCQSQHHFSASRFNRILRPLTLAVRFALAGPPVAGASLVLAGTAHAQSQAAEGLPEAAEPDQATSALTDDLQLHSYEVPSGPLGTALGTFASQSGLLLSFDPALTRGFTSPPLSGRYTISGGLRHLLAGTDLRLVSRADGSYTLAGPSTSGAGVAALPSVVVVADGISPENLVYTAPRSSVYLSSQEIDRFGRVSPADLLKGVPGVQVGDSRNGGALDVNIRGVQGQSRVSVKVDGSEQSLDVYRGYAGTQQRSYIDPDLISDVTINKGPTLKSGAIGGTVEMRTIGVKDILVDGKDFGIRIKGDMWNNGGIKPEHRSGNPPGPDGLEEDLNVRPRTNRGSLFGSSAKSGSVALAYTNDRLDIVAAYAHRNQGNYIAGKKGWDRYRSFDQNSGRENNTVAKAYKPGEEVLNSSYRTESFLLKTTIRPADGHVLELGYRRYSGRNGEIMPSDIFRTGKAGIYQYPLSEIEIDTYTARYNFQPAGSSLVDLTANLWLTHADTSLLSSVLAPTSQSYRTDRHWTRQADHRIGGDLSNVSRLSTGYGDFKMDLGGSFQFEELRPQKGVVITQNDINANRTLRDAKRQEFSLNGKLEYMPVQSLTLWTGGRYTRFSVEDNSTRSTAQRETRALQQIVVRRPGRSGNMWWFPDANGRYTPMTDPRLNNGIVFQDSNYPFEGVNYNDFGATQSRVYDEEVFEAVTGYRYQGKQRSSGGGFSPSVGFNFELITDTFVYASYTQGLRMPSLFETSRGINQLHPAMNLKPERSSSWEIGASTLRRNVLTDRDTAGLKIAYFNNNIKNYITRYYDPSPGVGGAMTFSNTDSYKTSGLELQSHYDMGRFFADLSATYYLKTETCDSAFAETLRKANAANYHLRTGATPNCTPGSFMGSYTNTQNPPRLALNLVTGLRFFNEALTVGGRMTYTSGPTATLDKPWQANVTTSQLTYREVTLFDVFLNYKPRVNTEVRLAVQNLTNRYYLDPLAQSMMPAPGRTVFLGMQTKF